MTRSDVKGGGVVSLSRRLAASWLPLCKPPTLSADLVSISEVSSVAEAVNRDG